MGFHEKVPAGERCITCGESAEGSLYWTPISSENWAVVREFVAHLFEDADHVQNVLFNAAFNEPYCGASCVPQNLIQEKDNGSQS